VESCAGIGGEVAARAELSEGKSSRRLSWLKASSVVLGILTNASAQGQVELPWNNAKTLLQNAQSGDIEYSISPLS